MENKIVTILLIMGIISCLPSYASELCVDSNYDAIRVDETIHIIGKGNVTIKDDEDTKNTDLIKYLYKPVRQVVLERNKNRMAFYTEGDAILLLPKNKIIKKIIEIREGNIAINGGQGDMEITGYDSIDIKPKVWSTTRIEHNGKGDINLQWLEQASNIGLALHIVDAADKIHNNVEGLSLWGSETFKDYRSGTLGNGSKGYVTVFANAGNIFLNE